jgi:hypothetical protein
MGGQAQSIVAERNVEASKLYADFAGVLNKQGCGFLRKSITDSRLKPITFPA